MSLKVVSGITPKQVEQLLKYSRTDPQIKKYTSDAVRFKSKTAFDKWSKEDRAIYTLVDKNGGLSGLIWFGKKALPSKKFTTDVKSRNYGFTFAIRTYGVARGKGYAADFMKRAYKLFTLSSLYKSAKNKGVWLVTSYDNISAIKIYKKFGFVKVTNPDKKGKILMAIQAK